MTTIELQPGVIFQYYSRTRKCNDVYVVADRLDLLLFVTCLTSRNNQHELTNSPQLMSSSKLEVSTFSLENFDSFSDRVNVIWKPSLK